MFAVGQGKKNMRAARPAGDIEQNVEARFFYRCVFAGAWRGGGEEVAAMMEDQDWIPTCSCRELGPFKVQQTYA
jgi:hypothetical protein